MAINSSANIDWYDESLYQWIESMRHFCVSFAIIANKIRNSIDWIESTILLTTADLSIKSMTHLYWPMITTILQMSARTTTTDSKTNSDRFLTDWTSRADRVATKYNWYQVSLVTLQIRMCYCSWFSFCKFLTCLHASFVKRLNVLNYSLQVLNVLQVT